MYRSISGSFLEWKKNRDRKPLIIIGARQVGKTWSVREFAKNTYKSILEINFQDNVRARRYFSESHSIREILTYLEINHPEIELNEDTLIFFDEVQLCPELITSLKFFPENCKSDVICSGSMLGVMLHGISSFPVGYVETWTMQSMSFTEFAIANGIKQEFLDEAAAAVLKNEPVMDPIHERLNALFTAYIVCGGMPEAVNACVTQGIPAAVKVNRRLVHDYEMDIAHYADSKTKIKALECFQSLPLQLAKENKKFQYKLVKEGYNARYYDESLAWLKNAGLICQVHRLKKIEQPLELSKEMGIFKVYLFDTGLLTAQFSDSAISDILQNALGMYKGVIYENAAAQILNNKNYTCYYYEPNTSSEIDFIIDYKGEIVPIEVKGGLHTRSKSFSNFIRNHNSKYAFRFSMKNAGKSDDNVTRYLPYYAMEWIL